MENGRVTSNPARLVRVRREYNARLRFLSRDEYKKLSEIILHDNPRQHTAFVVSVYAGMRWGEQLSLTWSKVDMRWKIIRLTQTKKWVRTRHPSELRFFGCPTAPTSASPPQAYRSSIPAQQ
jgi:integrase